MNIDKLNEKIYEAEEIQVVKDGDLKLPLNQLVIRNYTEKSKPYGRTGTRYNINVTEYNYVSEESLTKDDFLKIVKAKEEPTGWIYEPKKRKLTFGDGRVYYRHILRTEMF